MDGNGRKLSQQVENTVGKGEIARYEQFLLFPQCFQKACFPGASDDNFKLNGNGRKLSKQVENTVGKGEIACYEQFLLFPQCFQKACFPGASKGVIVWEWANKEISHALLKGGYCSEKKVLTHVTLCCLCRKARIYHNFFNVLLFLSHSKLALLFMCLQYKSFENTVGKGNIAIMSNFSQFPQFFLKLLRNFLPFFEIVVCKVF